MKTLTLSYFHTKNFCRTWESGFCYTYNPPNLPPTFEHRIGLFLGHPFLNIEDHNLISFKVYIHQRGQFWPKSLDSIHSLTISRNQYKVFKISHRVNMRN